MNIDNLPPYPHYPLKQGQTLYEVMYDINKFYGTSLGRGAVEDSQTYVSKEGFLQLDVVCKKSTTALITFRNYTPERLTNEVGIDFELVNPVLNKTKDCVFIERPLVIGLKKELDFLTKVNLKEKVNIDQLDGVRLTRSLTNLLNQYSTLGRWVTGSMGDLSTANFKLHYLGELTGKWNGYTIEKSEYGAIIEITEGSVKGMLCVMM